MRRQNKYNMSGALSKREHAKVRTLVAKIRKLEAAELVKLKEETLPRLEESAASAPESVTTRSNGLPQEQIGHTTGTKMVCQNCNRVPSPYARYLCSVGHVHCGSCAEQNFVAHNGKCRIEIRNDTPAMESLSLDCWGWDGVLLSESKNHFPICQRKLVYYPADPVFTAIWMNTTWKCPNSMTGSCQEMVKGSELFTHLAECQAFGTAKIISKCVVDGCKAAVYIDYAVDHLITNHGIYATDLGDSDSECWFARAGGLLYIPYSAIQARKPYYTVIRYMHRFFLFCMEPSQSNTYDMCFWIRRISNTNNKEDTNNPCFHYNLNIMNKYATLQMIFKKECAKWSEPTSSILTEGLCLSLPTSMILDQLTFFCSESGNSNSVDSDGEETEKGYLPVKFRIFVVNEVGKLYLQETELDRTSSMESLSSHSSSDEEEWHFGLEEAKKLGIVDLDEKEAYYQNPGDAGLLDDYAPQTEVDVTEAELVLENGVADSNEETFTEDGTNEDECSGGNDYDLHNDLARILSEGQRKVRYSTPSTSSASSIE